jgi:hypothetical protein
MHFVNVGKRRKTAAIAPVRPGVYRAWLVRCTVEYSVSNPSGRISRAFALERKVASPGRRGTRLVRRDRPDLWAVHRWI